MGVARSLVPAALIIVVISSFSVTADHIVTINKFETGYMTGLPTSGDYNAIAVGDIDGDGDDDMAFGGEDYGSTNTVGMYVYTGNGAGTWSSASTGLPTYDSWGGCAFGDADNDGNIELYSGDEGWGTSSGTINGVGAWEYSSGSWSTTGISSPETSTTADTVKLQNITGDSSLDLAIGYSSSGGGMKVYRGSGGSPISWTSFSTNLPTSGEYTQVCIIDLNNDGLQDIAGSNYGGGGIRFYTQGSTSWTDYTSSLPTSLKSGSFDGMEVGDVDNDGNADIIGATSGSGLKIALGNGGGSDGKTFSWTDVTTNLPTNIKSGRIFQVVVGDVDGDGDLDLLVPQYSNGGLHLYLGNGTVASGSNFRFTEVTGKGLPTTGTYVGANFLDFDADGILDVAGATWGSGVKVYRSNFTIIDTANAPPVPRITGGGTYVVGTAIDIAGNRSSDLEDCPSGDILGDKLTYDWNLTKKPAGSALTDTAIKKDGATNAFVNFTPDREGVYDITLAVKDSLNKWSNRAVEAKITITATNQGPVPEAGANLTAFTGSEIMLNGSGSGDPDGHAIIYDWNVTKVPTGSAITDGSLEPSDAVKRPVFTPDLTGQYIFSLSVKDVYGKWSASVDTVEVLAAKPNDRPVADAGINLGGYINTTITLNGSGSSDPDGTIVEYNWTCTTHAVVFQNATTDHPSFVPMQLGTHVVSLMVKDDNGTWSLPDEVRVTVVPQGTNLPPNADAGIDAEYQQGEEVHLDGSGSFDFDGSLTTWEWTSPSEITLNGSTTSTPWFTADRPGVWNFSLRVKDNDNAWSDPDLVTITVIEVHVNEPPIANAGADQTIDEDTSVVLDGSGSTDPDGNITNYIWDCTSHDMDIGSGVSISVILTDPGLFTFSLVVVDDEGESSAPDLVNVTVDKVIVPPPPIQNVTPTIGPFITDLDNFVAGATVKLTSRFLTFIGTTDPSGNVRFSQGIPPGNYTLNVTRNGSGLIPDLVVWIRADGSVSYPGGSLPRVIEVKERPIEGTDDRSFLEKWWLLLSVFAVITVVIVVAAIAIMAIRSGSGAGKHEEDTIACPDCGSQMTLKPEFGTYYCEGCGGSE